MISRTDSKRLMRFIERFPRTRTLVVGDVMLDHYLWGNVSRISPEAPVPVVTVTQENVLLGGATNVVNNIHALTGQVTVCGVIGPDDAGKQLVRLLDSRGISADGLFVEESRPTTIKTRVIAHNQQVVRFDRETKNGIERGTHRKIFDFVRQRIENGLDALVLSDYSKGVVTKELVRDIVKLARKNNVIVSVDPKVNHFGIYSGVTVLTPNTKEAAYGAKIDIDDDKSLFKAGAVLLKRLKCDGILITRGEQGMSLFRRDGSITHIPTVAQEVFDVTGAGDTVISAFTLAMAAGAGMIDAAKISNFAAGIVVGVVGTATVTPAELNQRIMDKLGV